ncbi:MAG: ABC transporter permease subunit [Propionibacteriaceae bacterium]|jgi:D-methionine transport system permease protein|nr:ABC transporter permease subunit [Propionibacteriaceae bacterium]
MIPLVNQWPEGYTEELLASLLATLQMVSITMVIGGLIGLALGLALYSTRRGGLFANRGLFLVLNAIVNFIRPIPFIIFITAISPVTIFVTGHRIGVAGAIFPMVIMASMATSRLVEQALIGIDPGIVEAGRAMGASRLYVLVRILIPEALAPLILAYAFLFIGVLDLSAIAGVVGARGLGSFAIQYGYNKYNYLVTFVALLIIVVIVQFVQSLGNWLARKALHR